MSPDEHYSEAPYQSFLRDTKKKAPEPTDIEIVSAFEQNGSLYYTALLDGVERRMVAHPGTDSYDAVKKWMKKRS